MPMTVTSPTIDSSARSVPSPLTMSLPAACRPTRPSVAPIRVANQEPIAISQMADTLAPVVTEKMISAVPVSSGR